MKEPPTLRTLVLRTLLGVAVLVVGVLILTRRGNAPTVGPTTTPPPPMTTNTPSATSESLPSISEPRASSQPPSSLPTQATIDGTVIMPAPPTPPDAVPTVAAAASPIAFLPDGRLAVARLSGEIDLCPIAAGAKQTLPNRHASVRDLAVSPDRNALAMAAGDAVFVWHRTSNTERTLRGPNATAVAWSRDGRTLASGHAGGELRLWDATTWAESATLRPGVGAIRKLAASPDNRTIAVVGESVALWDMPARRAIRNLAADRAAAAVFSGDGRLIALATAGGAPLYETTFWQRQATLANGTATGQVAFWRKGGTIVTSSGDGVIQLWDLATRAQQSTIPAAGGPIIDLALHADDRNLAASTVGGVFIIDAITRVARPLDSR